MSFVVAVDQGTSATKAILVDGDGHEVASSSVPVRRSYPRPGWVQQDAVELWDSVVAAIGQLPKRPLAAIGVSAQRESVLVWDRATGGPLTPCASWQCTRGAALCADLERQGAATVVRSTTGLPLDPMFSASKLRHLLDTSPELRSAAERGDACAGTVDSWLAWNMTGRACHVSDAGNASRTSLFDISRLVWSDDMLALFKVPRACLPVVVPSSGILAATTEDLGLGGAPLAALAADSHSALYGLGCREVGTAKATYGTGTSVASPSGGRPVAAAHGLATSVAWLLGAPTYAVEGNVLSSGATLEWVAGLLGVPDGAAVAELALSCASAGGAHIVPAFAGLGAPYWEPRARALIDGISFSTSRAQVARAALESIAFQVADVVRALEAGTGADLSELRADGGATRNGQLMQMQADLLGRPVQRTRRANAAAIGVARMAAQAVGAADIFEGLDIAIDDLEVFEPKMPDEQRAELLRGWYTAVGRARGFPSDKQR